MGDFSLKSRKTQFSSFKSAAFHIIFFFLAVPVQYDEIESPIESTWIQPQ